MLLANRIVAEHITMKKTGNSKQGKRDSRFAPFIYRIHDSPPSDKIRDFSNFLKSLGLTFPKENIKPLDYKKLIEKSNVNIQMLTNKLNISNIDRVKLYEHHRRK